MMKLVLIMLIVAYQANSSVIVKRAAQDEFRKLLNVLPVNQTIESIRKFLANDPSAKEIIRIIATSAIAAETTFKDLVSFLDKNGIPVGDLVSEMRSTFGEIGGSIIMAAIGKRSVDDFVQEVTNLYNVDEIRSKIKELAQSDEEFRKFYETISGDQLHKLFDQFIASETYQGLAKQLGDKGLEVDKLVKIGEQILGWI